MLLKQGQVEVKMFNNLYTQTFFFNTAGERTEVGQRQTFNTLLTQLNYGASDKVNVGAELILKSVLIDDPEEIPFRIFSNVAGQGRRTAVTAVVPKLKISLSQRRNISMQTSLSLPLAKNPEGNLLSRPFLDRSQIVLSALVLSDTPISNDFTLFTEFGIQLATASQKNYKYNNLTIPARSFLNYYGLEGWSFYSLVEFNPTVGDNAGYFVQAGGGLKHFTGTRFELELTATSFVAGQSAGAGYTLNTGLRYIH